MYMYTIRQPLTLVPLSSCRKSSAHVSTKTLQRRTSQLHRVRSFSSGGDSSIQQRCGHCPRHRGKSYSGRLDSQSGSRLSKLWQ